VDDIFGEGDGVTVGEVVGLRVRVVIGVVRADGEGVAVGA
jgi:hypothetical protein